MNKWKNERQRLLEKQQLLIEEVDEQRHEKDLCIKKLLELVKNKTTSEMISDVKSCEFCHSPAKYVYIKTIGKIDGVTQGLVFLCNSCLEDKKHIQEIDKAINALSSN